MFSPWNHLKDEVEPPNTGPSLIQLNNSLNSSNLYFFSSAKLSSAKYEHNNYPQQLSLYQITPLFN